MIINYTMFSIKRVFSTFKITTVYSSKDVNLLQFYENLLSSKLTTTSGYIDSFIYNSNNKSVRVSNWKSMEEWENWNKSTDKELCQTIAESMVQTPVNGIKETILCMNNKLGDTPFSYYKK